jgi:two-component system, NtrC family, response regulator HydG
MLYDGEILVVDDNEEILLAIRMFLSSHFKTVDVANSPELINEMKRKKRYDVFILDMNFTVGTDSGNEGFYWMKEILGGDPNAVIILMTAYGNIELAVDALKNGATDFIQKPWDDEKLLSTVLTAYKLRKSKLEIYQLKNKQQHLNQRINKEYNFFIGHSPEMKEIHTIISKVAKSDANVLILGENGTGKEIVAREIHAQSNRSKEVFIGVDMGSLSESLFESEMYGSVKGAYTGSHESRSGRFEIASGGSIFLDEIGNIPIHLQPKLLSTIQNREVYPVGSNLPVKFDARLIAATNQNLLEMVVDGKFREDLLYRINTIQITVPPLRERTMDIVPLAQHFISHFSDKYGKSKIRLSGSAVERLNSYSFPGNVRELENMVEKAVIMTDDSMLSAQDFFFSSRSSRNKTFGKLNLAENEKKLITEALSLHGYNNTKASLELGISRKTLYNKMKKYGL